MKITNEIKLYMHLSSLALLYMSFIFNGKYRILYTYERKKDKHERMI